MTLDEMSEAIEKGHRELVSDLLSGERELFKEPGAAFVLLQEVRRLRHPLSSSEAEPKGAYGVWCEAKGHGGNPRWLNTDPLTYREAMKEADGMNCANHQWHYTARPR